MVRPARCLGTLLLLVGWLGGCGGDRAALTAAVSSPAPLERLLQDPTWGQALQEVLETRRSGEPLRVRDGTVGRIVVLGTYRRRDGRWCRRFRIERAGAAPLIGFACRDPRGIWRLRPDPFARHI